MLKLRLHGKFRLTNGRTFKVTGIGSMIEFIELFKEPEATEHIYRTREYMNELIKTGAIDVIG